MTVLNRSSTVVTDHFLAGGDRHALNRVGKLRRHLTRWSIERGMIKLSAQVRRIDESRRTH